MTGLEIILLIVAIFFIITTFKAAFAFWKINMQLWVTRIFEIIPRIKEIKSMKNKYYKEKDDLFYRMDRIIKYFNIGDWQDPIKVIDIKIDEKKEDNKSLRKKLDVQEALVLNRDNEIKSLKKTNIEKLAEQTNIFKQKTRERKDQHLKDLDEKNILINDWKKKLTDVSKKLWTLVDVVRNYNKDEDVDKLLEEFDAFYVINGALIKAKRVNERQAWIHRAAAKKHKKVYDRLDTVCKKYGEPMEIKRTKRNKWEDINLKK